MFWTAGHFECHGIVLGIYLVFNGRNRFSSGGKPQYHCYLYRICIRCTGRMQYIGQYGLICIKQSLIGTQYYQ
ncbi:MAG: hypothetical protein EB145_17735 [Proteobacteria bacterium]|nr:hypothetical protein [Pseudomonadota bacterium]